MSTINIKHSIPGIGRLISDCVQIPLVIPVYHVGMLMQFCFHLIFSMLINVTSLLLTTYHNKGLVTFADSASEQSDLTAIMSTQKSMKSFFLEKNRYRSYQIRLHGWAGNNITIVQDALHCNNIGITQSTSHSNNIALTTRYLRSHCILCVFSPFILNPKWG